MRKAERTVKYSNLGWTPEGMRAYDEYIDRTDAAWRRQLSAANTSKQEQADFEEAAIDQAALALYKERMLRIGKKYPGVPMP